MGRIWSKSDDEYGKKCEWDKVDGNGKDGYNGCCECSWFHLSCILCKEVCFGETCWICNEIEWQYMSWT